MHAAEDKRMYGIDIFRFLLAIEVLMFHSKGYLECSYGRFVDLFLKAGAVTMTAFFIVSGYVNCYSVSKKDFSDSKEILRFYLKRSINILPSYFIVALLYSLFFSKESIVEHLLLFPVELLSLQSIFTSLFNVSHNNGTWFVSCIMICYFVSPLLMMLAERLTVKQKMIGIAFLTALLFYCPVMVHRFGVHSIYTNPFIRCFEFCIGMLLAELKNDKIGKRLNGAFCAGYGLLWVGASGILLYIIYRNGIINDHMVYSIFFLPLWLVIIELSSKIKIQKDGIKKTIIVLSAISYDIFLVQFFVWPITMLIKEHIALNNLETIACVFTLCMLMAVILHYAFEKPVQNILIKKIYNR